MFVEVTKLDEIAPGGMKAYEVNGKEIVLCNYDGKIYAVSRRCGHMNSPLEMGTLEGYILTCPLHSSQFDITTGEALSGPVPTDLGNEPIPENLMRYFQYVSTIQSKIKTYNIETYPVKVEGNSIMVDV
ncbi:MAG: non-heme iron oxygenase ferredoxin subunit [Candidatus Methanoperedens sp.]|nr:non-heme iron oxygenase ferredoxin subunit [Candidatus Methanoperedens sp.]